MTRHPTTAKARRRAVAKTTFAAKSRRRSRSRLPTKAVPAQAPSGRDQMSIALTVIEDAMIDVGETVFLLDQIQAHGEAFDDRARAYSRLVRLLVADMATLSAEYERAHAALRAGTSIERKAVEGAQ